MKQIKLKILIGLGTLLTICLLTPSCSDINNMHQKWLDEGETIYVGKLDSLKGNGGFYRVQIYGETRYARSAEKCIVRWEGNEKEFLMSDIASDGIAKILLEDLEEGNHRFFITTYDKEGNRSIVEECFAQVYGEEYQATETPKLVSIMTPDVEKITLTWSHVEKAKKVKLSYENRAGEMVDLELPGNVSTTEIQDWKKGGKIESITYVLPEEGAIDVIELDKLTQNFPEHVEYEVPKGTFKACILPTDISGRDYQGGGVEALFDGVAGAALPNRYHSGDNDGVPHHLTFDMGLIADLSKVRIEGTTDNSNWNPLRFQLWGRETMDPSAHTTLPSNDPGWENEALEKGWTLIIDATNSDRMYNEHSITKDEPLKVRYVRYRLIRNVHPTSNAYGCCAELTFWANDVIFVD